MTSCFLHMSSFSYLCSVSVHCMIGTLLFGGGGGNHFVQFLKCVYFSVHFHIVHFVCNICPLAKLFVGVFEKDTYPPLPAPKREDY